VLAEGDTPLDKVVNQRPAYAAAMREVDAAIREQEVLDPRILELCRLRIAQLLGASEAAEAAVAEEAAFTEAHRVCLGYAEQLLLDAQGVSDEQAAEVIDAVGEAGFLVLTYACGFFETTQRARLLISVTYP
jgi:hypothetical protein